MLQALIDLIIPPRSTERIVRTLNVYTLASLRAGGASLSYHEHVVEALVWELKYYANPQAAALAGEVLAEEVLALCAEELGPPLLVPVPMHAARRKERGHNQTEVLCEAMLPHLEGAVHYAPDTLVRQGVTVPQQKLPRHERLKNVHGSMRVVDPDAVGGRVCIVVDDVTTTGATLAECKRALQGAGARAVHTVVLAYS